jgi:PST family polysaccharide transporter
MEHTRDRKRLVENFFSLSSLQATNYLLPLITVPYLVRILGPEKFGLIAFAQAFVQYFVIFTDYGFNLSTTRKISIYREDKEKLSQIFSSVIFIKTSFMIISFLILIALVFTIPKFKLDWSIYLFAFGMVIGSTFFPIWFFQGIERMKYIAFLNILARSIFTVAIFVFVKQEGDYTYVPAINSSGSIIAGILSLWIVWRNFKVRLKLPSVDDIVEELKDGWHVFISTIAVNLYTISNTFLLGLFTNNTIVGYYSAAERIIRAIRGLLIPVSQTVYPYISKLVKESEERALNFIRKMVRLVGSGSFLFSLIIFIFAKPIVNIVLGPQYQESIIVLRILAFLPFIIGLSNIFGVQTMLTFNMKQVFSKILILAGFLNVTLAIILAPIYKHIGISYAVLVTEIFVTVSMFLYLQYKNVKVLYVPTFNSKAR